MCTHERCQYAEELHYTRRFYELLHLCADWAVYIFPMTTSNYHEVQDVMKWYRLPWTTPDRPMWSPNLPSSRVAVQIRPNWMERQTFRCKWTHVCWVCLDLLGCLWRVINAQTFTSRPLDSAYLLHCSVLPPPSIRYIYNTFYRLNDATRCVSDIRNCIAIVYPCWEPRPTHHWRTVGQPKPAGTPYAARQTRLRSHIWAAGAKGILYSSTMFWM